MFCAKLNDGACVVVVPPKLNDGADEEVPKPPKIGPVEDVTVVKPPPKLPKAGAEVVAVFAKPKEGAEVAAVPPNPPNVGAAAACVAGACPNEKELVL